MSYRIRKEQHDEWLPDSVESLYYAPSELHGAKLLCSTDDDRGNCFYLKDGRTAWLYSIDLDSGDFGGDTDEIVPNPEGLAK
jgi:hypothetical protein